MDWIHVHGLKVLAPVGVFEWERRLGRTLRIDLSMSVDANAAAEGDRIEQALDYDQVCQVVREHLAGDSVQLIETVAETLAKRLLETFGIQELSLTVRKPGALPDADEVGITLTRAVSDYPDIPGGS